MKPYSAHRLRQEELEDRFRYESPDEMAARVESEACSEYMRECDKFNARLARDQMLYREAVKMVSWYKQNRPWVLDAAEDDVE